VLDLAPRFGQPCSDALALASVEWVTNLYLRKVLFLREKHKGQDKIVSV